MMDMIMMSMMEIMMRSTFKVIITSEMEKEVKKNSAGRNQLSPRKFKEEGRVERQEEVSFFERRR